MPLLKRKPVPLVPLPPAIQDGSLAPDTPVYYLQATGEIFLDFESYSQRIAFYLQKVFTCEATGKHGLDYYAAMNSELKESALIHSRFPAPVKSKVLASAHFQVVSRFDSLIDTLFERYKDRYFLNDVCTYESTGQSGELQRFLVQVTGVEPPPSIRDLLIRNSEYQARCQAAGTNPQEPTPEMLFAVSHQLACDCSNPDAEVQKWDPADQYQYTVRVLNPDGSATTSPPMTATPRQLSRDRTCWSKTFLKKYLKECMNREGGINAPWVVKKRYALEYGLSLEEPEAIKARNAQLREGKRRKSGRVGNGLLEEPPAKRARSESTGVPPSTDPAPEEVTKPRAKPIKYPTEDLTLHLLPHRTKQREERAVKPTLSRNLPVDEKCFPSFLHVWTMLNVFGWPLSLSNFTTDQFGQALCHTSVEPHSELLVEVHGAMLSIIGVEGYRIAGTITATSTGVMPDFPPCRPGTEEAAMTDEEKERYFRRSLKYARKWDRSKRLHVDKQRQGWAKHLIGCLCQRGGIDVLPELPRILKHLLADYVTPDEAKQAAKAEREASEVQEQPKPAADSDSEKDELEEDDELQSVKEEQQEEEDDEEAEDDEDVDALGPQERYMTLPPSDKLAVLEFLCAIISNSKPYRHYIEDCEAALTAIRKERTDINKERRALLSEKALLIQQQKEAKLNPEGADQPSGDQKPVITEAREQSSRAPTPASVQPTEPTSPLSAAASDVDELDSETESAPPLNNGKVPTSRQAAMRESARKKASAAAKKSKAKANNKLQPTPPPEQPPPPPVKDEAYYDQQLETLKESEEVNDREFRRHQNVIRVRPLGMDRFFVKYWYFDGIGSMELYSEDGTSVVYGAGQIFVQGPAEEDIPYAISLAALSTPDELHQRRISEEGSSEGVIESGQWATLTTEDELEKLLAWLDPKGQREAALRHSITSLKPYILGGMKKRAQDLHLDDSKEEPQKGRRKGKKPSYGPEQFYMTYTNEFAWAQARKTRPKGW